jgi:hypothetical protein
MYATTLLLSVGTSAVTTTFTAGERTAELRQCKETNAAQDLRIKAVEERANSSDVTLEGFRVELSYIRKGVDELRDILRGKTAHR